MLFKVKARLFIFHFNKSNTCSYGGWKFRIFLTKKGINRATTYNYILGHFQIELAEKKEMTLTVG